jgi:hypothetical protein
MLQKEGDFWRNSVKPQFDKMSVYYRRVESPLTPGFPDTIVIANRVTSLIEIKSKQLIRPFLGLQPIQKHFLQEWIRHGGNAYLLAQVNNYVYFLAGNEVPFSTDEDKIVEASLVHGYRRSFDWMLLSRYLRVNLANGTGSLGGRLRASE